MSITINGSGDINATGNDIELNSTGTTDVTLAVGGGSVGIGTATPTEKLTVVGDMSVDTDTLYVDSANNRVGFGTTTPDVFSRAYSGTTVGINSSSGESAFMINSSGTNVAALEIGRAGTRETLIYDTPTTTEIGSLTSKPLKLLSNGTERARIKEDGNCYFGRATYSVWTEGFGIESVGSGSSGTYLVTAHNAGSTSGRPYHYFFYNNNVIGSITQSGTTGVAYNTSSDYRLKENVVELTGAIDRVKQVPVHRFNFIADPDRTVDGFLAHEVQPIVPEAIHGTKDEIDAEGNPVYQGIDQSKLVPLLTQALKDAITKIETLETANADMLARIEALEAV